MVSAVYTADGFNVSGSWKVEKEIHLAAFSLGAQNLTFERGMDHLIWDFLPKPQVIEFFPGIKQCKVFHMKLFWGVSFDTPHTLQTSPPPPKRGDLKKIGQIKPKSKRQKILS